MKKRVLASLIAFAMIFTVSAAVYAKAPSEYDGKSYESLGYTSEDPDGEINLAVIANGDVKIVGDTMYIEGSVYSNGNIYVGDGQGNKIAGLFISGTESSVDTDEANDLEWVCDGYIHVNDNGTRDNITYYSTKPEYEGAIADNDTGFECAYIPFEVPAVANDLGDVEMNVYESAQVQTSWWPVAVFEDNPKAARTITEDTHIGTLTMNGSQGNYLGYEAGMVVDTTAGDVVVVIDNLGSLTNPSIKVVGENEAYIYIGNAKEISNLFVNYDGSSWPGEISGSVEHTHLYIAGSDVVLNAGRIAVADMNVNSNSLEISGSTKFYGDIASGAESFVITGGETEVTGIVCVPNADSRVVDSGTLYGQLHTNTLTNNGAGRIIWKADTAVAVAEKPSEPAAQPTSEATEPATQPATEPETQPATEPATQPTEPSEVPSGDEISLKGVSYAYIFGYEPYIGSDGSVVIEMAMDDAVTVEQVSAMVMRLIDQKYGTMDVEYPVSELVAPHAGQWYERGLAYMDSKGAFAEGERLVGNATRGQVAKLIAFGLNLTDTAPADYTDVEGSKYLPYIEIVTKYGYMQGDGDGTFAPDRVMTRAEFCSLFNNIIGRNEMGLTAQDGSLVTAQTYYFTDMDESHWAYEICLKATSAYDENGLVDVETRLQNIRNKLDKYDGQKQY